MTHPLERIASLEAQIAELKRQVQESKTPKQMFGRLGSFQAYGEEYVGVCIYNKPDSDGDVRIHFLNEDGDARYRYLQVENVKWLTGNVLTFSEDIEELPNGTVVCLTENPNTVAVKIQQRWYPTTGGILSSSDLAEAGVAGVEVIRYGVEFGL